MYNKRDTLEYGTVSKCFVYSDHNMLYSNFNAPTRHRKEIVREKKITDIFVHSVNYANVVIIIIDGLHRLGTSSQTKFWTRKQSAIQWRMVITTRMVFVDRIRSTRSISRLWMLRKMYTQCLFFFFLEVVSSIYVSVLPWIH